MRLEGMSRGSRLFIILTTVAMATAFSIAGHAEQAVLVRDITPGTASTNFGDETAVAGNRLFFTVQSSEMGNVLWKSDGTEEGTEILADIVPGFDGVPISEMTPLGGLLFFRTDDGIHGEELWVSDGTAAGTRMVRDINVGPGFSSPRELTVLGGRLFFRANDGDGNAIWTSDGTEGGTQPLLAPDSTLILSNPENLTAVGSRLFFTTSSLRGTVVRLYRTDGTEAGVELVREFGSGGAAKLTAFGSRLLFAGGDAGGIEPWISDGTTTGTVRIADLVPGTDGSSPTNFIAAAGRAFFLASTPETGLEPWATDGTAAGTLMLADIRPGPDPGGITQMTAVGGRLFFRVSGSNINGRLLYTSDGTPQGTGLLRRFVPEDEFSVVDELAAIGSFLYFQAGDDEFGRELWISDGTEAGTRLLVDIDDGTTTFGNPLNGEPKGMVPFLGAVFLQARRQATGVELYKIVPDNAARTPWAGYR